MDEKKKSGLISDAEAAERITVILAILLFVGLLIGMLSNLQTIFGATGLYGLWQALVDFLIWFWPIWKIIVILLVVVCLAWAVYSYIKLQQVVSEEEKIYGKVLDDAFLDDESVLAERENEKWKKILEHANSDNPADWRLAIIEADVMLEEVLRAGGYTGDGVGEMLKSVDSSDLLTLDAAWEAHKVRNRIAHDGSSFQLDEHETKHIVSLFESVFREFGVV